MSAETHELREKAFNAHEALKKYHDIDELVPVGGLPPRDYERILEHWAELTPTPEQAFDLAWVELERALAMMRSDINYATEEPYTQKEISAAFEATRRAFHRLFTNEDAPRLVRAQARVTQVSIDSHKEILTGRPPLKASTRYLPYVKTIRSAAEYLINQSDLADDERRYVHALTVASNLTQHAYTNGWFLPAAPRQPWDVTAHNAKRGVHDVYISPAPTENENVMVIDPASFALNTDDEFAAFRHYLAIEPPDYVPSGPVMKQRGNEVNASSKRRNHYQHTENVATFLINKLLGEEGRQKQRGVLLPEQVAEEKAKEKPITRDISDAAMWYLLDFDGEALDVQFTQQLKQLEELRRRGEILPEERSAMSWMQLDRARILALNAGQDRQKLDEARLEFGKAIGLFESAERQFKRKRRPGEAYDAALAAQAAAVERGLYTSTDRYAVRRIINTFHTEAASLFVAVKEMPADADQVAALRHSLNRATLSLLAAAADPETRHLVLPASPRLREQQIAVAFPVIFDEKASGYDLAAPIAVQIVDGNDIVAGDRRVEVGRDALAVDGNPLTLLRQLASYLSQNSKPGGKSKSKNKPAATLQKRSTQIQELSERLAYAISDADEGGA